MTPLKCDLDCWRAHHKHEETGSETRDGGIHFDVGVAEYNLSYHDKTFSASFRLGSKECDWLCQKLAEALSLGAAAVDVFALGGNAATAVLFDLSLVAAIFFPPLVVVSAIAAKDASFFWSIVGSVGTAAWAAHDVITGDDMIAASAAIDLHGRPQLTNFSFDVKLAQDTIASAVLDGLGVNMPEPNSATAIALAGVIYDLGRNPAPDIFPWSQKIPTVLNLAYHYSMPATAP